MTALTRRLDDLDWNHLVAQLEALNYALVPSLLSPDECGEIAALYAQDDRFRSRVVMARHGFGLGEYKYFSYPLPPLIAALRGALYPHLAQIANAWSAQLGLPPDWPEAHADLLDRCKAAGQSRPTPLLLRYGAGDYNCLHQDLYGDVHFPFQAAILLDRPREDFEGGEFVLVENRPRRQSRCEVVPLGQGDLVIFPVRERPRVGGRGPYRTQLRHGVSSIRRGERRTLGVIFHDAV